MSTPPTIQHSPANRLGINYRDVPPRRSAPLIDAHTHISLDASTPIFFEAAALYGVQVVLSMSPLADVDELKRQYGDRIQFIAVPRWRDMKPDDEFRQRWINDLVSFWERGARLCKFWMAPPMRQRHGHTLDHPFLRPVIDRAVEIGYQFLIHVGDPTAWFRPGGPYADSAVFGTKAEQYPQVDWFCEYVRPRAVIGAHLGGTIEDPAFLDSLLARHANYYIDSSATKWVVREIAPRVDQVRELLIRRADRVLFGSDLVTSDKFASFDHHASRYWTHQMLWETDYDGESPIEDPDANPPLLRGLSLPESVLDQMYRLNVARLGLLP